LLQSDERTCMNKILPSTNNWRIYIRGMFCYNLMNVLVWTRSYSTQTTGEYISEVCFVTIWWTYLYEQGLTLHKQLENIYQRYVLLQSDENHISYLLPFTVTAWEIWGNHIMDLGVRVMVFNATFNNISVISQSSR
jgi:hypothetical protein